MSRAPIHTVCPLAMSWRAVSLPRPLFAPVINVVVIVQGCAILRLAGSGPVVIGLPGPPQAAAGLAYWNCGFVGVRPHRRRWRDRFAPETVGVPIGNRRRATGLRREELAGLASISVDYLTRLEQGRATSPSMQVVESLARALRLPDVEREYLFRLAGLAPPGLDVVSSRVAAQPAALARPYGEHTGRRLRRGVVPDRGQRRPTTPSWETPRLGAAWNATTSGAN